MSELRFTVPGKPVPQRSRVSSEELVSAYKETGSIWKTAKRLGICGQSVHERLRRLEIPLVHQAWTTEEDELIESLASQAVPISRIAERVGRTYAGVACRLSRSSIKHPYTAPKKVRRGCGHTKESITKLAKTILSSGTPVTKEAKRMGIGTTGLVTALQKHAPELWEQYKKKHGSLPDIKCPGCGCDFTPLTKKQKYCSTRCGSHARSDASYFGGNRRSAIGLADGICQLCNLKKDVLSAHHVLGKDNDPDNLVLVALCAGCHQLVGILGRRANATEPEFWENLISLATARALADKGTNVEVLHVTVEIEPISHDDAQLIWSHAEKLYGDRERTEVVVRANG